MAGYYEDIYPYKPSLALALFAAALFGVLAILHDYQTLRSKTWFFAAFVVGGYLHTAAFCSIGALILVAPALFAASMYMFFGCIVRLVQAEHHAIMRIGWLTRIFVLGDAVSFAAQVIGAVILNQQTADSFTKGSNIITIGLTVQIVFFGLFLVTSLLFHIRTNQHPTVRSRHPDIPWKQHMHILYAASASILLRCIYRFIEYHIERPEKHGYLLARESPMYAFDSLLMLAVMVLFFVKHPSVIISLQGSLGGVAMRLLSGRHVKALKDIWGTLPQPVLGPKMYYEAGGRAVRMDRRPSTAVQLAEANGFRA